MRLIFERLLIGLPNDSGAHDLDELDDHDDQQHAERSVP